ncbi:oxidase/Diels-Alderase [Daldinia caldariorum]|uniref:oxidase/Diels-Alderase n=1 Tax=Daldinia caldariorum TaxID=326644 RepID=UPI0020088091|nr:oxidase/Diels-Alderase [Daldinia caldariorum]KAI1462947.1 oxidase/Diels-Alderase [Daldinia caldariorum]
MHVSWFPLLGLTLVPSVLAAPSTAAVDNFLRSIDLDPSEVPTSYKTKTGIDFTCAILSFVSSENEDDSQYVARSSSDVYTQQAQAHWSPTAWKSPSCIFSPDNIDDLGRAVLIAGFSNTTFAVRSGGHSPLSGWASIDNSLLISMTKIDDLDYDEDSQTQRSGMGNRWGAVYENLVPYGRIVVGGRLNVVGLGLATGGGLSHFSNQWGWVGQNVVAYEIMLSNGTHVKATATQNSDLYYAAKAGSNNFGIVTHITQRTYPMGKVWGGLVQFPGNSSKQFMAAMAEYQAKGQLDTKSAILPYVGINNDSIIATFVYLDGVVRPDAFKPFFQLPILADYTQVFDNFYEFANIDIPYAVPRWTYAATTLAFDSNSSETYQGLIDVFSQFKSRIQKIPGGSLAPMIQPVSKSMIDKSRALGDDPMNVEAKAQLWIGINIGWLSEKDDAAIYQILQDSLAAVESYTKARNAYLPFVFLNDAWAGQKPFVSYGQQSLNKLKTASKKYDKSQMFQRLVVGGFKL